MKNIFTLIAIFGMVNLGLSQEEKEGADTTRFKIGKVEFIIVDSDTIKVDHDDEDPDRKNFGMNYNKNDLTYWSGFEVGVNMLMNNQFESKFTESHLRTDPANSFVFNFNLLEHRIRFGTDHVGLVTGIGFTNSRFGFSDDHIRLAANSDSTYGVADSSLKSGFTKNQLIVNYFNIPVLLHFNTSKNHKKNFHVSLGVIGGVRMGSKVKYKYENDLGESKDKLDGRFNVNPFHLSLAARMGYRNFGLFANFDMLPLFENGASRVAKPLTFGASFHF